MFIGALKQVYGMVKSIFYRGYSDAMKKLRINLETTAVIRYRPWKLKKGNDRIEKKFSLNWDTNIIQSS